MHTHTQNYNNYLTNNGWEWMNECCWRTREHELKYAWLYFFILEEAERPKENNFNFFWYVTSEETGNGSSRNSSSNRVWVFIGKKNTNMNSYLKKKLFLLIVLVVAVLFIAGTYILLHTYIGKGYIVYMWITHTPLSLSRSCNQLSRHAWHIGVDVFDLWRPE